MNVNKNNNLLVERLKDRNILQNAIECTVNIWTIKLLNKYYKLLNVVNTIRLNEISINQFFLFLFLWHYLT